MAGNEKDRKARPVTGSVRRPRSVWQRWRKTTSDQWQHLLGHDAFWIVTFLLLATWAIAPIRGWSPESLEPGDIAPRDFVAPRDALVLDREATDQKRQRAREEVLPVYDFDPGAADRLANQIAAAFTLGREAAASSGLSSAETRNLVSIVEREVGLRLDEETLSLLARRGFSRDLEERLKQAAGQILERGVVTGKTTLLENRSRGIWVRNLRTGQERRQLDLYDYLDYPDETLDALAAELRAGSDLSTTERAVLLELLHGHLVPNFHLNQSETRERQERSATAVEQVFNRVRQGQVLVRRGDQVDAPTASLIEQLSGRRGLRARVLPALGVFLFLSLLVLVLWLGIRKERVVQARRGTVLGEALLLFLLTILGTRLGYLLATGVASAVGESPYGDPVSYFYAIPFASLALVTVLLYGRALALLMALAYSLLAALLVNEGGWAMVVYAMAGSLAAILTIDHFQFKQRSVLVRVGMVVGGVNVVTVLMLAAIGGRIEDGAQLAFDLACALGGGVLVAAATSFLIPVLESLYGVTTAIKLVELANTNLPLLRRLAFEAPGTFQHSLMVANLAKAGCEAIGADSVLAYTGALYHDVGKIFRPEYFVENQRPGHNRHDKLLPSMSALILISHVREGLDLAEEYHLPQPIKSAIAEHHGTRLISYFYSRAKEMQDPESGGVAEEKFRYPGPRPHNEVMGILMLADGVEAACRSLDDPSPMKIRTVIKAITDDCLGDGQLDDTDLTLGQLKMVADAFQRVLSHIHHRRLDYPGFDFNARPKRRDSEVIATAAGAQSGLDEAQQAIARQA